MHGEDVSSCATVVLSIRLQSNGFSSLVQRAQHGVVIPEELPQNSSDPAVSSEGVSSEGVTGGDLSDDLFMQAMMQFESGAGAGAGAVPAGAGAVAVELSDSEDEEEFEVRPESSSNSESALSALAALDTAANTDDMWDEE